MSVEQYLKQNGYKFKSEDEFPSVARLQDQYNFHKRIELKKKIENYPRYFELLVKELMVSEFDFSALSNVKIQNEGNGGDFDVLAINSTGELVYLECKTGTRVTQKTFRDFYTRHLFLRPSLSIIVFDQQKSWVKEKLQLMRKRPLKNPSRFSTCSKPVNQV